LANYIGKFIKKMLLYMHSSFGTIYKTYYTTGLHQI